MAKRLAMTSAVSGSPPDVLPDAALPGPIAGLGLRSFAFFLDSVVLLAFTLAFAAAALLNIYFRSDNGRGTAPDSANWTAVAILVLTVPAWLALNLLLGARRGQSVGHYVLGLQIVREDGSDAETSRHLLRLVGLNPLVFHPFLAVSWALLAFMALSIAGNATLLVFAGALCALSVVAPLVAVVAAALDHGRRTLHDRIAGTVVIRLG